VARIALGHHVGWLKDGAGDFGDREGLVESLLGTNDRSVRGQHEVDTRVRHQVGLKFGNINVQGTVETKGSRKRTNDLGDQAIQVGVGRFQDAELTLANVVKSFVVEAESDVGVFQKGVGGKNRVVGFNDGSRDLGTGRDGEGKLGLAAVINRKTFQQKRTETGSGTSSRGVEDEETL